MKQYFKQYKGLPQPIYILFFGRIVTGLGAMVWPMLTMILSQKMGFSASEIAVLMIVVGFIMIPANLLGGKLADKYNKKMVIVYCDAISIIFYIICGLVPLSRPSIILMVVAAICQQMETPSYQALIADLTLTRDRERAYSLLYLGGNLGLILSPTISGFLFRNYLWLAFIISGIAIGTSTILIYLKIKDIVPLQDDSEEAKYQAERDGATILDILKENRTVLLFLIITALYSSAYRMSGYLMPLDLGELHGDQGAVIYGTINSLNCVIVVLFTPLITKMLAKTSDPGKLLIGQLLVTSGYLTFLIFRGIIPFYYAFMTLFTWGEIAAFLSEGPYTTSRIPASHRGRLNGVSTVFSTICMSAYQLAAGLIYDHLGSTPSWIFTLLTLVIACGLTLLLRILDRRSYPALYPDLSKKAAA